MLKTLPGMMLALLSSMSLVLAAAAATHIPAVFPVTSYGAVADDGQADTTSIQSAIDACTAAGGGEVLLAGGEFLAGHLELKDNVTLVLQADTILRASRDREDFRNLCWLETRQAENVGIRGPGTLIGNGSEFFRPTSHRLLSLTKSLLTSRAVSSPFSSHDVPFRYLIRFERCTNVRVETLTILDSPGWTIHLLASSDILVTQVRIENKIYGPHTDGINLDSSSNAIVSHCQVTAGNDAFCVKSSNIRRVPRPSSKILFENCLARTPTNGFKIGSETLADIDQVTFRNCQVKAPLPGLLPMAGLNISSVDGSRVTHIRVESMSMEAVQVPVLIRLGNRGKYLQDETSVPGSLEHISLRGLYVTFCTNPIIISGLNDYPVQDVRLQEITIQQRLGSTSSLLPSEVPEYPRKYPQALMFGPLPAWGIFSRHVKGLTLTNILVDAPPGSDRAMLTSIDVTDLSGKVQATQSRPPWSSLYWALPWLGLAGLVWRRRLRQTDPRKRRLHASAAAAMLCMGLAYLVQLKTGGWRREVWLQLLLEPYAFTFIMQVAGYLTLIYCGVMLLRPGKRKLATITDSDGDECLASHKSSP